jgi:hypothetical protein
MPETQEKALKCPKCGGEGKPTDEFALGVCSQCGHLFRPKDIK